MLRDVGDWSGEAVVVDAGVELGSYGNQSMVNMRIGSQYIELAHCGYSQVVGL